MRLKYPVDGFREQHATRYIKHKVARDRQDAAESLKDWKEKVAREKKGVQEQKEVDAQLQAALNGSLESSVESLNLETQSGEAKEGGGKDGDEMDVDEN
jgi:hypothetical protein